MINIINLIKSNWLIFTIALFVGFLLGLFTYKYLSKNLKELYNNAIKNSDIIKKYLLVCTIILVVILVFYFLFKVSGENLIILNHLTTIIFAMFAGYIGLSQLEEGRIIRLKDTAILDFRSGNLFRAIDNYEKIISIDKKNFASMSELLELYAITKNREKFDEKISILKKIYIGNKEKLIVAYLEVAKYAFLEEVGIMKDKIKEGIEIKESMDNKMDWSIREATENEYYKRLGDSTKKMFINYYQYISEYLNQEQKEKFKNGNYELT